MDEFTRIEADAHRGAMGHNNLPEPTQAQKLASNYKVGRTTLHGMAVAIEQPRGSFRSGVDAAGRPWQNRMSAHYGYLVGTTGNDGDALDVFIGYYPESRAAFVINQVDQQAGAFDEHKIMLGFPDAQSAFCAYLESYHRGWQGLGDIVPIPISQLKWWAKHGNHTKPINAASLPILGYDNMKKVMWDGESPIGNTYDGLLYDIRRHDDDGLMYDPLSVTDILDDAEGVYTFDALVTPFAKLERKMQILQNVMERTGGTVKPVAMQITEPFKQRGTANVAVVYELSDGQTLSIFFHNPDVTPQKITPTDDLISWKWMLNKKDVTIVAAPERGVDLNVREVANRLMRLAERNSATFQRANAKRSARMQAIDALKTAITEKEATLARLQRELEVRRVEKESTPSVPDSISTTPAAPIADPVAEPITEPASESAPEPIVVVATPPEPVADPVSVETGDITPEEIVAPPAVEAPEGNNPISEVVLPLAAADLVPAIPAVVTVDPVAETDPAVVAPAAVADPAGDQADDGDYYPLSENIAEASARWRAATNGAGTIEPYMQKVIEAVQRALDAGKFYTTDVLASVITDFGSYLRPGDTEVGKGEVEGGIFGMEVYYAREFIRNQSARKALADAEGKLNLRVGTTLGTLVFNDFKVNTNCVVDAIDGATITVAGKRGKYVVKLETNALGIQYALERAFSKGKRKSAELVAPMAATAPEAAVEEPTPVPESQPVTELPIVAEAEAVPAPVEVTQEAVAEPAVVNEPTPVEQSAPAIPELPAEMTADEAFLQSVIDGQVDIFDPALSTNIEAILTRNPDDAEILAKWQRAVSTYTAAMMAAASQTLSN
ncbi:MAG: hypothetical protein JWQ61_2845 [Collimonas fungivorans]|uniref:defense against restriction DarA-related protein n=1 Tax=Collimonas fungivorans TaxID=158899 RepID=UPI0026ED3D7A|nr:hypothetical protein [Collimonas fungivorans]MDB5768031.1 hypothetical protein [Collimonas fungivorans]